MTRANPFDDMPDFIPETKSKPVKAAALDQIAKDSGFVSRQPAVPVAAAAPSERPLRRLYTTGRNQQMNIKATAETVARFYRIADEKQMVFGELLEAALDALEAKTTA